MRGFKFVITLDLEFQKLENDYGTKCTTFYFNSKVETIINKSDIIDVFESVLILARFSSGTADLSLSRFWNNISNSVLKEFLVTFEGIW